MKDTGKPKRRRNVDAKQAYEADVVRLFTSQYGRKAHKGHDPNDRRYDRKVEQRVKRMKPEKLDRLLHGNKDDQ